MSGIERFGRFAVSLLAALLLQLLVMPNLLAPLRPMWLPLMLGYTALNDPAMPVLLAGFLTGLACDVLLGAPLGEHALALVGLVYLILRLRASLLVLPPWQATLVLAPVWALYAFALFWLDGLTRHPADPLLRWLPVATTTLIWPLVVAVFATRRFRDRRRPSIR